MWQTSLQIECPMCHAPEGHKCVNLRNPEQENRWPHTPRLEPPRAPDEVPLDWADTI
ncbi:zinc finger domain-containing protein [Euzebya tangerina]|uniref:zinc finger domain-containing protein n=1 Tax=Euzebya tangerina TaxID=591198 RepID=UPI003B831FB0